MYHESIKSKQRTSSQRTKQCIILARVGELSALVNKTDASKNKKHEVFEPSFDWKLLESDKFMEQKLDYIHQNPCRCNPQLACNASDYEHSSAR